MNKSDPMVVAKAGGVGFDQSNWHEVLGTEGWLRVTANRQADGSLKIRGAFAAPANISLPFVVMLNEHPAQNVVLDLSSEHTFNNRGYTPSIGFEFAVASGALTPYRVWISDSNGKRINKFYQDWIYIEETGVPYPGADLQSRNNATSDDWYHFAGGTFVAKLPDVIRAFDARSMDAFQTVLDWGCGTGRLSRHLPALFPNTKILGTDIDSEAIAWAQRETPGVDFRLSAVRPPMPIADATVDLVISHSVFSHLDEGDQFIWLDDLRRVVKPGGIACITTHSQIAPFILPLSGSAASELKNEGFACFDVDIIANVEIEEGYRARQCTYQSHGYIQQEWSRYFEILGICEGYADYLAMVVMKAR